MGGDNAPRSVLRGANIARKRFPNVDFLLVGDTAVRRQRMAILANAPGSDGIVLQAGPQATRAILVAGRPLNEPIAQYGPFVMNTQQEIFQAVEDFRAGRLA